MATKSKWPTKPIESNGLRDDFPYVNPSRNLSDDIADGKYDFYFDYSGTYVTMNVRLTDQERDAYIASITSSYGYYSNGLDNNGNREYIKNDRRLVFGQEEYQENSDVYTLWIYKLTNKMVPDLHFDNMVLDYREDGYVIGGDIIRVHPLDDAEIKRDDLVVSYWLNGNNVYHQTIKESGSYEITVEVRYPETSMYMTRRITATITIQ